MNLYLTNSGQELLYKAQGGKELNFTRFGLGNGELNGQAIQPLTNLISEKLVADIIKLEAKTNKVVLGMSFTNAGLEEGFYFRELGIYAEDPDTSEEVLYMYANAGETADYIDSNTGRVIEEYLDVEIQVSNVDNISAVIDESLVYLTIPKFNEFKETLAPIIYAGDIALVDGENTTLEEGTYYVNSLSVNGVKNDKFYNAIVRIYTAENGWTYISVLANNNMLQQGYNFYNVGYNGSTWSVYSVEVAKKEHTHNYVSKTGDTMSGPLTIGNRETDSVVGTNSFASGNNNKASGENSFSQGNNAQATAANSMASGQNVMATSSGAHALGSGSNASTANIQANSAGAFAGGHASSGNIIASNYGAIAHGFTSKGYKIQASGYGAVAIGAVENNSSRDMLASATGTVAFGVGTQATKFAAMAVGMQTNAISNNCFAEGKENTAGSSDSGSQWWSAHAEGNGSTASGYCSHVEGRGCIVSGRFQHVFGRWNTEGTAISSDTATTGDVWIVGKGTSSARSNAARLTIAGKLYLCSTYSSSGADYAEITEWSDGNINNEDRVGRFVCMEGEKMRFANSKDVRSRIGVVSAEPAVLGDSYSEEWRGKYKTDVFGRKLTQTVTYEPEYDEEGNLVHDGGSGEEFILSEEYDETQEYIRREERQEYDYFGMLGKLIVIDDGTCEAGGYCYPNDDAIATAELDENKGFYVMNRIDETHIKILLR